MADRDNIDLTDLAVRAKRREPLALAQLFDVFFEKLRRYAYYQTGDLDGAEDIAADAIRAAIESLDRFDDRGGMLSAWMYGIARNLVARQYRDHSRGREVGMDQAEALRSGDMPEDRVLRDLSYEELYAAISMLPGEQREVIVLRYIEGYGSQDVGRIMGKRSGAVRGIQHRAIRSLRRKLLSRDAASAGGASADNSAPRVAPRSDEGGLESRDVT